MYLNTVWIGPLKAFKYFTTLFVVNVQLDDLMVALESERAKSAALDKKQRKFDQSLAEEKAVSER